MSVSAYRGETFEASARLIIVGAGAAGLCAALAAREAGLEPLVIERDPVPLGSTALSAGLIPAAGTRFQRMKGIHDRPEQFAADIQRKASRENNAKLVETVAREAGPLIKWLADCHGFPFDVIDNFNYPGHSVMRMHGLPTRTGAELINRLRVAVEASGIDVVTNARVDCLIVDSEARIRGIKVERPDGARERIGCSALILACNGFGGNAELVRELIPEMADALYFGHAGNQGDAIIWGRALGAQLAHLGAYQGHGSVATPHNILITWAVIMEGGIQVNVEGRRFSDESSGYSEQAVEVLRQPGGVAWDVFDSRMADVARQFEDFRAVERAGALLEADSLENLAVQMRVPADVLAGELRDVEACRSGGRQDRYGRRFSTEHSMNAPWHAVKVTGALFHTQGGLAIDESARVLRENGRPFPNLLATGGAAAGLSGESAAGYLSGNGLLSATVLGRIAARSASAICAQSRPA
jgi:flavocytochrome c